MTERPPKKVALMVTKLMSHRITQLSRMGDRIHQIAQKKEEAEKRATFNTNLTARLHS